MVATLRKSRRATLSQVHRPRFENLEDRVVPSIASGTILVATAPSPFATVDQSSFPTGIIGVNPSTGEQSMISTGGLFSLPTYFAEAPNQQLYVSDLTAFGTGAIIRVDPNTGQQSLVATGGLIHGPNALVFLNGFLYVADEGDASGMVHDLLKIDPNTGAQTLVTSSSGFTVPTGMAPAPGNNVYVSDEPGNVQGMDPGKVWKVNLDTGQQTLLSSNNSGQGMLFNHPVDLAVDASGNLLVANTGSSANDFAGSIIRIDPQSGAQTLVTAFGSPSGTDSVTVGLDGTLFVGAIANGATAGQLIAVDPVSGAQSLVASGGNLSLVEGIAVLQPPVQTPAATTTTVNSLSNPSVFGQSVTWMATVSVQGPGSGTPTGTVQFLIDGNPVGNAISLSTSGTVTISTASLAVGPHRITASYSGDASFASSSGTVLGGQIVNPAGTATAVVSSVNPSVSGQTVTFTATVSAQSPGSGTPTGTVQFVIDGKPFGSPVMLSGGQAASGSISSLGVGGHTITANYSGDGNFATSTGSLSGGQTVQSAAATPTVTCSVAQSQVWPPNHKLANVGLTVIVTPPDASLDVLVFANDNADSSDAADLAPGTLQLRAERKDDGRVYLIIVQASNSAGTGFDVCTVVVPHDQSSHSVEAVQQQAAAAQAYYRQYHTAPAGFALLGASGGGGSGAAAPGGSPAALLVKAVQADNGEIASGLTAISSVLVPARAQAQPVLLVYQSLRLPAAAHETSSTLAPSPTDQPTPPPAAIDSFFTSWDGNLILDRPLADSILVQDRFTRGTQQEYRHGSFATSGPIYVVP